MSTQRKELRARILEERKSQWSGKGTYKEPVEPKVKMVQLPSDSWTVVSIDQIATDTTIGLVRSAALQNSNKEGVPYLKMDKIDMEGRVDLDDLVYVDTTDEELQRFSLRKGDVLFNTRNSVELVGKTGYITSELSTPTVFNNNLMRLRFVESVLPAFVATQMCSKGFRDQMEGAKRATTSIAAVYGKDLRPLPIALPPLPEQRRIVSKIEELFTKLDAGVAALKQAKAQLKRYRQSVLAAAVTGELTKEWRANNPNTEPASKLLERILKERREQWNGRRKYKEPPTPVTDNLPQIPSNWTWATVAQQADPEERSITDGPFGSKLKSSHYTSSGPRVLRLQNIGDGVFKDEYAHISEAHFETLTNHQIFPGDLLIRALGIPPHQTCIIPEGIGPSIVKADCIRYKVFEKHVDPKFILFALNSHPIRTKSEKHIHGVGRPRLNGTEIKSITLPLPPLDEQNQIVAEVEARTTTIDHIETELDQQLARSNRLRQSILSVAFQGQL